jgi:DnaJ like chaperone protein
MVRASAGQPPGQRGRQRPTLESAYETLGLKSTTSDAEIKRAYRRLMSQHHPDKLVAKGLPEEMMKMATEKTHQIRTAYETIQEVRKK